MDFYPFIFVLNIAISAYNAWYAEDSGNHPAAVAWLCAALAWIAALLP